MLRALLVLPPLNQLPKFNPHLSKSIGNKIELIRNYFEKWKGNLEQVDDVCIIGVRV